MNWPRILLWANGIMFVAYGVACVAQPALPADSAGFLLSTPSGSVEIIAMYGGLQAGFGAFLILGARDIEKQAGALLALGMLLGCLAGARLIGMAWHGPSPYNLGAFGYEFTTTLLAVWAIRSASTQEKPA